jgi:hypothetical protein
VIFGNTGAEFERQVCFSWHFPIGFHACNCGETWSERIEVSGFLPDAAGRYTCYHAPSFYYASGHPATWREGLEVKRTWLFNACDFLRWSWVVQLSLKCKARGRARVKPVLEEKREETLKYFYILTNRLLFEIICSFLLLGHQRKKYLSLLEIDSHTLLISQIVKFSFNAYSPFRPTPASSWKDQMQW